MRFWSSPIAEHSEVPVADGGELEQVVTHWSEREQKRRPDGPNDCYVVSLSTRHEASTREAQLAEIVGLVEAQGDQVVGSESYELTRPDARTLVGKGVAERLGEAAKLSSANLLVLDANLTPSQARNLEDATGLAVCDREAVILNVFERNAKTDRARVQVEIAHLQYLRPRIRGIGLNMDQQAGGVMGSRGPGETASELLARRLDHRLAELKVALARLQRSDQVQRRHRADCARVVLVGYTNAGKTSLMNALCKVQLSTRDRPFETLETTSRSLSRFGQDVIISDTVGFIRRLPERLFASFESTLAELSEASLLLMVADVSDPECEAHLQTTEGVLARLQAQDVPRFYAFNKCDRLETPPPENELRRWSRGHDHLLLSSRDTSTVAALREAVLAALRRRLVRRKVFVPYAATPVTQSIYASCRVLDATPSARGMLFSLEGSATDVESIVKDARRRQA